MAKITIVGVPEFAGEYELDKKRVLTGWEAHIIMQIAEVGLAELDEAADAGNYDLVIAFTVIALVRAEQITKGQAMRAAEVLLDAELGKIVYVKDPAAKGDALPPVSKLDSTSGGDKSSERSGSDGNGTGDHQETTPLLTGDPG